MPQRREPIVAFCLTTILSLSASAQDAPSLGTCKELTGREQGDGLKAVECVAALAARIDAMEAEKSRSIAQGAVMAFDLGSCPNGWSPFADAQSRFIVGAGFGRSDVPMHAENLSTHTYRSSGGEEQVVLSASQTPSHVHKLDDAYFAETPLYMPEGIKSATIPPGTGHAGSPITKKASVDNDNVAWLRETSTHPSEGNQPHNNMPPYIALYFCKKD